MRLSLLVLVLAMQSQFEDTVVYRGKGKGRGGAKGRTSSTQHQQQGAYASMTEMLQVHNTTIHVIREQCICCVYSDCSKVCMLYVVHTSLTECQHAAQHCIVQQRLTAALM
jgi:hypothetical protein